MAGEGWAGQEATVRAPRPDVFALKDSGLQAFLYAEVGTEPNGSTLTMLSVLARLGNDPWAQAANWASMPRTAAIDDLSKSIAQMPLAPAALVSSHDIAARLVEFLPGTSRTVIAAQSDSAAAAMPNAQSVLIICCGIAAWAGLTLMMTIKPATVVRPPGPPMATARSIATVAAPPAGHAAAGASVAPPLLGTGQGTQGR